MVRRYVLLMLVLLMTVILLSSCGMMITQDNPFSGRFIEYHAGGINSAQYVIVDKVTGTCYLLASYGDRSGLTLMVDSKGAPVVWTNERR